MDLLTLLSVCTLGFDHKLMQGIVIVQSEGKPYAYKEGDKIAAFDTVEEVIKAARRRQEQGKNIRIGLMGADIDLLSGTAEPNAAMFEPCVNVNIASRKLQSHKEICENRGVSNLETCAIASYLGGGYENQDESRLDFIMSGAITGNLPNPDIKDATPPLPPPPKEDTPPDTGRIFFEEPPKEAPEQQPEKTRKESLFFD